MKRLNSFLLTILLAITACSAREPEDISQHPAVSQVIGLRYEVIGEVDAYGIRRHTQAPVTYITLIPPPGIAGSEVGSREPVPVGTRFTVRRVLKTSRVIDPDIDLVVEMENGRPADVPVLIALFRGNEGPGFLQLNPAIYRKLSPVAYARRASPRA